MTSRFKTCLLAVAFTALTLQTCLAQSIVPAGQVDTPVPHNHGQATTVHLTDGLLPTHSVQESFSDSALEAVPVENCTTCSPAPTVQECDCHEDSCSRCRLRRPLKCRCKRLGCQGGCAQEPCVQCPSCDGDVCKLSVKKEKEKKTCFKTKQEQICIPAVRLPWQKCCPPTVSKTRVVTRLKKHTYECDTCKYKWSVVESKDCGESTSAQEPTVAKQPEAPTAGESKPQIKFDESEVPNAPSIKGAFLRPWRSR